MHGSEHTRNDIVCPTLVLELNQCLCWPFMAVTESALLEK